MARSGDKSQFVDAEELSEVAFERHQHEFQALAVDEIVRVNIDVPSAIARALGALPIIQANRERLRGLPEMDLALVDALEDYTLALQYAHTEYLVVTEPPVLKKEMLLEGKASRNNMLIALKALEALGKADPEQRRELKRGIGFMNLASDLALLAHILDGCLGSQEDALISPAQRRRALKISKTILSAVGRNERRDAEVLLIVEQRDRVFTWFTRSYREAQEGMQYLGRKKKNAGLRLPSLWPGKGKRSREKAERGAVTGPSTPEQTRALPAHTFPANPAAPASTTLPLPPTWDEGVSSNPFINEEEVTRGVKRALQRK